MGEIPVEFSEGYISGTPFSMQQNQYDLGYNSQGDEYSIEQINKFFAIDNYFCPPDIFKYCVNSSGTTVEGIFNGVSDADKGLYGKIPEFLFNPISNIASLSKVFSGCILLLPYDWGNIDTETDIITYGRRYPLSLFSNMPNLRNLNEIFLGHRIFGKTELNLSIFPNVITSLSGALFRNNFIEDSKIDGNLYGLRNLIDVSSFLAFSNTPTLPDNKFITPENNPNISECSEFMRSCKSVTVFSTIPEIWKYNYSRVSQYIGAFYDVNIEIRDALEEISNKYIPWMLRLN